MLFHAKSRRNAGATFFVAGRDPAGIKRSELAPVDPDDDMYDGNHGRFVLHNSPGQYPLDILPFGQVYYDKRDHVMRAIDESRPDDFISISGTKMRTLAAQGAHFCDVKGATIVIGLLLNITETCFLGGKELPSDLVGANCIPPGFMVESGWKIVCAYYQDEQSDKWIPYSVMRGQPSLASGAKSEGQFGTGAFKVHLGNRDGETSAWHDVSPVASEERQTFNMVI